MKFSQLNFRYKLFILLVPISILYTIIFVYFFLSTNNELIEDFSLSEVDQNSKIMNKLINDYQTKALVLAKLFANNENVYKAYLNPNEEEGSNFLKKAITPLINNISKDINVKNFQVHYHKKPAKSFLRSWTDKRFDDLSRFRPTILSVFNTKEPLKAIEFGVGGFAIRGITPIIYNEDYLGSVEFLFEIKDLLNTMITDQSKSDILNIVEVETAEKALTQSQIEQNYKIRIDNYLVSDVTTEWIKIKELLDDEVLDLMRKTNTAIIKNKGDVYFSLNPIFDYEGNKIGYVAFLINNSQNIAKLKNAALIKVLILFASFVVLIILLLVIIDKVIIQKIKLATEIALKIAAGDLSYFDKK